MSESESCGECETVAEKYKNYLNDEKRNLISFRGHGLYNKTSIDNLEPFSTSEIKTMLKLISLGCKKLHFVQNEEPIDIIFDQIRIVSDLEHIVEG